MLVGYAASIFPVATNSNNSMLHFSSGNSSNTFTTFQDFFFIVNLQRPQLFLRCPFYLCLAGAMFCLLMSSTCHLLSCHSSKASYIMLCIDFSCISDLIVSSFYPMVYYTFTCQPFFRNVYLCSITSFGLAAVGVSLMPVFDSLQFQFRPVRAILFACMAASEIILIAHKMLVLFILAGEKGKVAEGYNYLISGSKWVNIGSLKLTVRWK